MNEGRHGVRLVYVGAAIVVASSFAGFFVGTGERAPTGEPVAAPRAPMDGDASPAPHYTEMNRSVPGSEITVASRPPQTVETPELLEPEQRIAQKRASLAYRAARRAYNGAPPLIPHPVDQRLTQLCLVCHGVDRVVQNVLIPKISHEELTNCTQCHAPGPGLALSPALTVENGFHGAGAPLEGQRAWSGAPPTVPHATLMRGNCLSCHGPNALPGLQTTHPERQSCLQCHAPSAVLDQLPSIPPSPDGVAKWTP